MSEHEGNDANRTGAAGAPAHVSAPDKPPSKAWVAIALLATLFGILLGFVMSLPGLR
jgi:hypothetical protein